MSNLTTVANVKSYLGITTANQDTLIAQLIIRESAFVENWCGRKFTAVTNTNKRLNGTGTTRLVLPDNPILSVSALSLNGTAITLSTDAIQSGYVFDDQCLYLVGGGLWGNLFTRGFQNVQCSWVAGYETTETDYVPTGNTPTITPSDGGTVSSIVSVYDNTSAVTLTQVGSAPVSGQYSLSAGVITFNSTQYNHSMTIDYYFIPAVVEQSVIEMIGLDLQQKNNIGISSKKLATETVVYSQQQMSPSARDMLMPYKRMVIG